MLRTPQHLEWSTMKPRGLRGQSQQGAILEELNKWGARQVGSRKCHSRSQHHNQGGGDRVFQGHFRTKLPFHFQRNRKNVLFSTWAEVSAQLSRLALVSTRLTRSPKDLPELLQKTLKVTCAASFPAPCPRALGCAWREKGKTKCSCCLYQSCYVLDRFHEDSQ